MTSAYMKCSKIFGIYLLLIYCHTANSAPHTRHYFYYIHLSSDEFRVQALQVLVLLVGRVGRWPVIQVHHGACVTVGIIAEVRGQLVWITPRLGDHPMFSMVTGGCKNTSRQQRLRASDFLTVQVCVHCVHSFDLLDITTYFFSCTYVRVPHKHPAPALLRTIYNTLDSRYKVNPTGNDKGDFISSSNNL